MLAIGRGLMARPKLMLLDEPSLGLSPLLTKEIFAIIRRLNQEQGVTMLLVEQNANMALKTAHYGYVLETGRIVLEGECSQADRERGRARVLSGTEGNRRARQEALEAHQALALEQEGADPMNAFDAQPIAIDGYSTVPALFWHRVTTRADKVAMREKDRGIWKAYTWRDYGANARAIGMGLIALGLEPGDCVAILSDNNKEWLFCDLARAVRRRHLHRHLSDRLAGAGRVSGQRLQGQVPVRGERGAARQDPGRARAHAGPEEDHRVRHGGPARVSRPAGDAARASSARCGESLRARAHAQEWEQRIAIPKSGDVAIIVYTSGTTGPSKGALLTHRNIIFQVRRLQAHRSRRSDETDEALNFLPLCHVAERFGGCYNHIASMHVVNFAEAPDTVPQNLREVAPHIFLAVPRVWEKLYSGITIRSRRARCSGRLAYKAAIGLGTQGQRLRAARASRCRRCCARRAPSATGWCSRTSASSWASTASAMPQPAPRPISPDLISWYWALGIRMYEVYGQTENAGPRHLELSRATSRSAPSA